APRPRALRRPAAGRAGPLAGGPVARPAGGGTDRPRPARLLPGGAAAARPVAARAVLACVSREGIARNAKRKKNCRAFPPTRFSRRLSHRSPLPYALSARSDRYIPIISRPFSLFLCLPLLYQTAHVGHSWVRSTNLSVPAHLNV